MNNDKVIDILKEMLKWQKLHGREILKNKLANEDLFSNEKEIRVYYHSDGDKSSREIGKLVNVSHATIQNLWKKWVDAGLVEPTEKYGGGRCKRLFSLDDLGLELPKIKNHGEQNDKQKNNE